MIKDLIYYCKEVGLVIKWGKCISCINRGTNVMNTIQIKMNETSVPSLGAIKHECNKKVAEVENYILMGTDLVTRETNMAILQEARISIEEMFNEMHTYVNFTGTKNVEAVLEGISERFELVELMNEDEGMRNEEYFEVLLDLPFSVNAILKLEQFKAITTLLNLKEVETDVRRGKPKTSFKDKVEVLSEKTTYTKVKTEWSPIRAVFNCKEELIIEAA